MDVYTDDLDYARKVIPEIPEWRPAHIQNNSKNAFVLKVFQQDKLLYAKLNRKISYNYLFISKIAHQSQFDLLYSLSKDYQNLPDGIICLADSGRNFHGYRNRKWNAVSGNLHLSIFRKPNRKIENFHTGFTIISAISVLHTLDELPGLKNKANIKWVNDIIIDDAKISGVITQTQTLNDQVTAVVLGVGLNVEKAPKIDNDGIFNKSTSVVNQLSNQIIFSEIFLYLIDQIDQNYQILLQGGYTDLLKLYKNRSIIINQKVAVFSDKMNNENELVASGVVNDIGNNLELLIDGFNEPIKNGRIKLLKSDI